MLLINAEPVMRVILHHISTSNFRFAVVLGNDPHGIWSDSMREPATKCEIPQNDRVLLGFEQYDPVKSQCYTVRTQAALSKLSLPIKLVRRTQSKGFGEVITFELAS